jgi:DNA (cytosine-5)-methyltransferase 1
MKYFSMFSGIGGFELAIKQAYESIQKLRPENERQSEGASTGSEKGQRKQLSQFSMEGLSCIGFSEIDKYAIQVYQSHFDHKNYGNATTINANELPDFDLLVGGFPCQAFSIAGKRRGFEDTRGTLFFDIARILRAKQPRNFVLENVKGLLSHDNGQTFRTIIATLADLGYDLQWQVLNSKNFGVPQNRERVFIVGHLRGTPRPEVFPITGGDGNDIKEITRAVPQAQRVYDCAGISPTLDIGAGGNRQPKIFDDYNAKWREDNMVGTLTTNTGSKTERNGQKVFDGMAIRRLTPTECERLQGFPDGWTKGISDSQRYKTLGNAVTVNTVQAVIERLAVT